MKAQCLPFSQVPHTSRLFLDFLAYSPKVQPFYPRSPQFREWAKDEASRIHYDATRRQQVAAILERQNRSWNASPQTLANIERFRRGAAALVTGQQVGLFGGPTFSLYKALTAVKLAQEATSAGIDTVPVFWLATYDHDLAEVNHVSLPAQDGSLQTIATSSQAVAGAPVSHVLLGDEIVPVLDQVATLLGDCEALTILRETYAPGHTLGTAFASLFARLFGEWGVVVLDASDPELHKVAQPIYRAAIERADELAQSLLTRGRELEAAGYHQQVKVTESSVLLFTLHQGARTPIQHKTSSDEFVVAHDDSPEKLSRAELLQRIDSQPELFSANVLLRPIVEDFLLPTLAYTGGAAEAAYFAQAGAVYEMLLQRVTPLVPRYSATLVESKMQRLLEKHQVAVTDVFRGPDALRQSLAEHSLPGELKNAFDTATQSLEKCMKEIQEKLSKLDRTLVDAAQTSASKMSYQLERLYTQAARAESQKGEVIARHADQLSQALYPNKGLQERGIGGIYFLARYGTEVLRQIHDAIQPDCHDHQILEL